MNPSQQKSYSISDCNTVMISDLETYNRARERWEATSELRSIDRRRKLFSSVSSSSCTPAHERKVVDDDHEHNPEKAMVSESAVLLKTHERIDDNEFPCSLEGEYSPQQLIDGGDDGGSGVGIKGISGGGTDDYFGAAAAPSQGPPPPAPSSGFKFDQFNDSKTAALVDTVTGSQNIGLMLGGLTSKNEGWCNPTEEGGDDVLVRPNDNNNHYSSEDELQSEDTTTNSSDISSSEREEELAKALAAFDSVAGDNPSAKCCIGIEAFPVLFEKLGTVYCEEEHRNTFRRLQDENGCVARDVFINWYVGWLFGENDDEGDDFLGGGGDDEGGNEAALAPVDKSGENEVLSSHLRGFGDSFKLSPGSWKCDSCMVTNFDRDVKCIACETFRVGISSPTSSGTRVELSSSDDGLFGGSSSMGSGVIGSTGFIFGGGNSMNFQGR